MCAERIVEKFVVFFLFILSLLPLCFVDGYAHAEPEWTKRGRVIWGGNLHEPLAFYKRENCLLRSVPATSLLLEDWYNKVRSEETIKKLSQIGVNLLLVNFAKGAGDNEAFEDRSGSQELVKRCHKYGIRVLAYIQVATKHVEEFFEQYPHAVTWGQIDRFKHPKMYSNRYYRRLICPANSEYVMYLKTLIKSALADYKFDGVFLDNFYYTPCYCEACQSKFKNYVKQKFPEPLKSLGIANLQGIRIPEIDNAETVVTDRLHQVWVDWRLTIIPEAAATLRQYTKELSAEAAFCGNIVYPRMNNWHLSGIDVYRMLKIFDLPYAEGNNFPRWEKEICFNNAVPLFMGCSLGANIVMGMWQAGGALPESADKIELALGESLAYGGHVLSGIWALRMRGRQFATTEEELSEPYFTKDEIYNAWSKYNNFFIKNKQLYINTKQDHVLGLYHSEKSMAYDFGVSYRAFLNASQALHQYKIPYGIVFSQDLTHLAQYRILFLCSQRCISDDEIKQIEGFVASGGTLIITGESGLYNEYRIQRRDYGFKFLTGSSIFSQDKKDTYYATYGKGKVLFFPQPAELDGVDIYAPKIVPSITKPFDTVTKTVMSFIKDQIPWEAQAPKSVSMSIFKDSHNRTIIHLLNYDNNTPVHNLILAAPQIKKTDGVYRVRALSPDGDEYASIIKQNNGQWVLQKLKTYTVIMVER